MRFEDESNFLLFTVPRPGVLSGSTPESDGEEGEKGREALELKASST